MIHFQQTMLTMTQNFLSTQQEVMLCYLKAVPVQPSNLTLVASGTKYICEQEAPMNLGNTAELMYRDSNVPQLILPEESSKTELPLADAGLFCEAKGPTPLTGRDNDRLIGALLDLISERTGYPVDMLDPGLDLESDLGIDSIKRIEILNKFQHVLPIERRAALESALDELAGARTVNQIIEFVIKSPCD